MNKNRKTIEVCVALNLPYFADEWARSHCWVMLKNAGVRYSSHSGMMFYQPFKSAFARSADDVAELLGGLYSLAAAIVGAMGFGVHVLAATSLGRPRRIEFKRNKTKLSALRGAVRDLSTWATNPLSRINPNKSLDMAGCPP